MAAPLPQMLTANRLTDGDVLYWKDGGWVESLDGGDIFAGKAEADAALAAAQAFVANNAVVNPYLFDVQADGRPVKEREIIRAAGPSVRDDLGKQASSPSNLPLAGRPKKPPDFSTAPHGGGESDYDVSI